MVPKERRIKKSGYPDNIRDLRGADTTSGTAY